MECIFCDINLKIKNTPSYFAYVAFCEDCPFRYYDYDNNLYFRTKIYEFAYYGFNRTKIYPPNTVIVKSELKIIFQKILELTKADIISYFSKKSEEIINQKIQNIFVYV